jgi:hypothetical protein
MPFPEISDYDFSSNGHKNERMREALDYADRQHRSRTSVRKRLEKLYNAYNGYLEKAEVESIVKASGKKSKTKYVKYRLGRAKLKQLQGEFLEVNITPTVRSTNPEAVNKKMDKYKRAYGMSLGKPYIEKLREMGYPVHDGFNIPDKDDPSFWNMKNFKLANEIIIQDLIDGNVEDVDFRIKLYHNFIDLSIAAQFGGKVERNQDGIDDYRFIPAKNLVFEEEVFDPFLERTPYFGEERKMYLHEILANPEFNLTDDQKDYLKSRYTGGGNGKDPHIEGRAGSTNNHPFFNVMTIQWKGLEKVVEKTSPAKGSNVPYKTILSQEFYEKNKKRIKSDVKAGKYTIETYYQEIIWTATKIDDEVYTAAEKEEDVIQILRDNGKYSAEYDYVGCLFSTVNGERVSVQEIIYELEKIYDDIRFQINREIRKIKGSSMLYDQAFLPIGKRMSDIIYDISEDGLVTYNSAAEGNRAGIEAGKSSDVGIKSIDLGENQSIVILMNQAMDIERVMDRVTGMNENRQGLAKATSTATANVNNIEASRSMTYDLFYFMNAFIEKMLVKLAEKSKLNITKYGKDSRKFILSDEQIAYLLATDEVVQDNYGIKLTDGKKEKDILTKLELMFPQEINASTLTSGDVAKFLTESNFTRALKVLDQARERHRQMRMEEIEKGNEAKHAEIENERNMAIEAREDDQAHDKDMEVIRTEGKKEVEAMKIAGKGSIDAQKQSADMVANENTKL